MQFPLQNPGIWFYKTKGITIVNTELLDCLGLYISSAPVEGKGYKRIFKLPDWLNNPHTTIKSPKQYAYSRIYPVITCFFLPILRQDKPGPDFLRLIKYIREVSSGSGSAILVKPGFTITGKNAEERTTGNTHQGCPDSMRGQKRTAKDHHKLPVGLLKNALFLNIFR